MASELRRRARPALLRRCQRVYRSLAAILYQSDLQLERKIGPRQSNLYGSQPRLSRYLFQNGINRDPDLEDPFFPFLNYSSRQVHLVSGHGASSYWLFQGLTLVGLPGVLPVSSGQDCSTHLRAGRLQAAKHQPGDKSAKSGKWILSKKLNLLAVVRDNSKPVGIITRRKVLLEIVPRIEFNPGCHHVVQSELKIRFIVPFARQGGQKKPGRSPPPPLEGPGPSSARASGSKIPKRPKEKGGRKKLRGRQRPRSLCIG
jgi:hypothetical protein